MGLNPAFFTVPRRCPFGVETSIWASDARAGAVGEVGRA
jgi:hypothetical protein